MLRDDLCAVPPPAEAPGTRPLLCLIHVTDLQLADVQSPTRFEFLNRYFADHPEMVLGEHALKRGVYGPALAYTCRPRKDGAAIPEPEAYWDSL